MSRRFIVTLSVLIVMMCAVPVLMAQDGCTVAVPCMEVVSASTGVSAEVVAASPSPDVIQLVPDDTIIFDSNYRRVLQAVDIYDAPNGNIIRNLAAGFNFVTTGSDENGWTQINPNEWVKTEFLGGATVSRFSGVLLPDVMEYPMGWILVTVIPSRTPGAEPVESDLPLYRYTRVNLFTHVEVEGWTWYQVGTDQWVHQTLIAKVLPVERSAEVDTDRWVSVDLYEQVLIAYEGTTPVFATLVSSGLPEWSTNEGLFHVYVRYERTIMSGAEGAADFYSLESVPYVMYFDRDIGLHGTYWHDGFGYRHSHGCVNLSIMDAHWIYEWASAEMDFTVSGDEGAAVYVYSSGSYR